jgi:hypothetical protein
MEEWRPVNDYPNYFISSLGRVKRNDKIHKNFVNSNGYLIIDLYKNNKRKKFRIHRLVGIHFLPNWNNCKEIDHLNRDRLDNRVINLRWATRSENLRNKKKKAGCSSKYKGVSFQKRENKWCSQIVNKDLLGRRSSKFLGYFNTEEEAYNAWKKFILDNNLEKFYQNEI